MSAPTSSLLAEIVHDLRSPLSGLVALIDLIEAEAAEPLGPTQRRRVARLRASVDRLTAVVNGIAELAQVEGGGLTLRRETVDLEQEAHAARLSLAPSLESWGVALHILLPSDLPSIQGDPARVRQMMAALFAEMSRHAEGGALELSARQRGSMIDISLREPTHGLPVEVLPAGLTPLEATPVVEPDAAGAPRGLGYALARGLAALHGGRLAISRDQLGALVASLSLPVTAAAMRSQADTPHDAPRLP